ncbi:hypothetical protein [Novosphingobium sp. CECT 9465]|jgi:hypothetical protein|nr:hypothetical protein [Novosphingobium sp. CECT 9465]
MLALAVRIGERAMTNDLDVLLRRLREEPLPSGLDRLDQMVFERLALIQQFPPEALRRASLFAIVGAALLGMASSAFLPSEAASSPLTSFALANPLAPSTLLLGAR